jgi:xanthine dehydrogenase YagT iron-sulfur-binding subunit
MEDRYDEHNAQLKDPGPTGGVTRRGFLTSMGAAGVVAVTSVGAAPAEAGTPVIPPDVLTKISLNINGKTCSVLIEPRWTLLLVLRDKLGLTGTKVGCERGECGACTVLVNGKPQYSCLMLAVEAEGKEITTIEGLTEGEELGPVQQAFAEEDAYQCGYCTSGQMMSVEGLLRTNPDPSVEDVRIAGSGNLCRCGAYHHIAKAGMKAAKLKSSGRG